MRHKNAGFTLMEMIGVVAVIAILASMATPMIFDAIRNARVTSFVEDANVARTAVARYYEDTGNFPVHVAGSTNTAERLLLSDNTNNAVSGWAGPYMEQELENPFNEGDYVGILSRGDANYQFDLDGDGNPDTTRVSVLRVDGVSSTEAQRISDILDGDADVATGNGAWFAAGRVKLVGANQNSDQLLIYLARE
ncbi:MAG: prepilin-type N-terminal cleavage/methylation domain-containing protein [Pseudomonadota bacterium]